MSNFPRDSIDKKSILNCIELTQHWIHFMILSMKNLHIDINQLIHLEDTENIEVFVNEKDLKLMVHISISNTVDNEFHYFLIDVVWLQKSQIYLERKLESVILNASLVKINKLLMSNFR